MPKKTWNFEIDGISHTVELKQGAFFRGKDIRIDGKPLDKELLKSKGILYLTGSEERFQIDGHETIIYIYSNGFQLKYDLALDGISIQTGKPVLPQLPIPIWAWPLMVLNGIIVFLGGAVPVAIGLIGIANCYRLARDPEKSLGKRIGWCVGVTVLSWSVLFLLMVVMVFIFHRNA